MDFKKLWKNYKETAKAFDIADAAWEANYTDKKLEEAWNAAYDASYEAEKALKRAIMKATGCTPKTARIMIAKYDDRLADLIGRLA